MHSKDSHTQHERGEGENTRGRQSGEAEKGKNGLAATTKKNRLEEMSGLVAMINICVEWDKGHDV